MKLLVRLGGLGMGMKGELFDFLSLSLPVFLIKFWLSSECSALPFSTVEFFVFISIMFSHCDYVILHNFL